MSHAAIPTLKVTRSGQLCFSASDLTTNGIPGLTNATARFLVSGIPAYSAQGGRLAIVVTQAWARFYEGPRLYDQALAMARDGNDNVVVAGHSLGATSGRDFATIKYSPDGTALWTNRYDGAAHGDDDCQQVLVDNAGNVFVAGASSYDPANYLASDAVVVKYSPEGTPLWTNRFSYYGTNAFGAVIAPDQDGNLFVVVGSYPPAPGLFTVKCDPAGVVLWTNLFRPTGSYDAYATAAAVDSEGNLIVSGCASQPTSGGDYVTIKYSRQGALLWTNYFHRTVADQPIAVAVDAGGRVFVTGDAAYEAYATVAYRGDGLALWTNFLPHPIYSGGGVPQTRVGADGRIFITGGSASANGEDADFTTVALGPDGGLLWTNRFWEPNMGNPWLGDTLADPAGQFYLAGHSTAQPGNGWDFVVLKLFSDGKPAWTNRFQGPAQGNDLPYAITVDRSGAIYVTGCTAVPGSTLNGGVWSFATVKYIENICYTPAPYFVGTDSFSFVATDAWGHSGTNTVLIEVMADRLWFNPLRSDLGGPNPLLHLDGAIASGRVILYAAPDATAWVPIATNTPVDSAVEFLVPRSGSRQFYRAVQAMSD